MDDFVGVGGRLERGRGLRGARKVDFESSGEGSKVERVGLDRDVLLVSYKIFIGAHLI